MFQWISHIRVNVNVFYNGKKENSKNVVRFGYEYLSICGEWVGWNHNEFHECDTFQKECPHQHRESYFKTLTMACVMTYLHWSSCQSDCVDCWCMSCQSGWCCLRRRKKVKKKPWTECRLYAANFVLIHSIRPNICLKCSRLETKKNAAAAAAAAAATASKQIESTWRVFISILIFCMYI